MATLRKAKKIAGMNIYLRDVSEEDAKFIFDLRIDAEKNRYLSLSSDRLQDQVDWIKNYASRSNEAYFVICDNFDTKLGCVRMYSPANDSYCWGSWLMKNGLGPMAALESVLLIYAYGKHLGFNEARIEVRKLNEHVWRFHEKFFSAILLNEDDLNRHYVVRGESISEKLTKYRNLLTNPLNVVPL